MSEWKTLDSLELVKIESSQGTIWKIRQFGKEDTWNQDFKSAEEAFDAAWEQENPIMPKPDPNSHPDAIPY